MFIWMPKINFTIQFFFETLHIKESCHLIGQHHFGPQLENQSFARYEIDDEISITILVFILDYFQEKIMTKFFKKSPPKCFFAQTWTIFFFWKQGCISF